MLSGIVTWGLKCGKKDVPGVYADVTQGLCFIDWVTKCIHGDKYQQYYNYPQCNNWLENLIAKYVQYTYLLVKLLYFLMVCIELFATILFSDWKADIMKMALIKRGLEKQLI